MYQYYARTLPISERQKITVAIGLQDSLGSMLSDSLEASRGAGLMSFQTSRGRSQISEGSFSFCPILT